MSDIMEKTLASLPSLLGASWTSGRPDGPSRAFHGFINCLSNINTKYDEEQFVQRELSMQKQRLSQPGIAPHQMREYLVRLLYCHLLGYDVSFAYIHAVKLAQQGTLLEKRAGYVIASLFLQEQNELVMLLINTIQKDLRSTNLLEICMALTAATQLVSAEMIPAILPQVIELLKHSKEIIRKKAVLSLHKFYTSAPELLSHLKPQFHTALCDRDPGVMWAALQIYFELVKADPASYGDLVEVLVGILKQILERRLSADYEYHNVPAPWLQIHVLKLLAMVGAGNKSASEKIYPVLGEVLQRTETSHKIGLAVIYECLETIMCIHPQPALVEHAAKCVTRFLGAKSHNLKYLGIKALSSIVQLNPGYAASNQDTVIECLDHSDQSIRTKTLDLLYKMTNPHNVVVICTRLMETLTTTDDEYLKLDLLNKIADLAERYAQSGSWYIECMNKLLLTSDSLAPTNMHHKLIILLSQGTADPEEEVQLRIHAVNVYWKLLQQSELPNMIVQAAAWVLGEYSQLHTELSSDSVITSLLKWLTLLTVSSESQTWLVSAVSKLVIQGAVLNDEMINTINSVTTEDSDLRQRLSELKGLVRLSLEKFSHLEEAEQDKKFDFSLSFLDDFVSEYLENGGTPYKPLSLRYPQVIKQRETTSLFAGLKFTSYESPLTQSNASDSWGKKGMSHSISSGGTGSDKNSGGESSLNLKGVKKVWGKAGMKAEPPLPVIPSPVEHEVDNKNIKESVQKIDSDNPEHKMRSMSPEKQALTSALFSGVATSPPSMHASIFKKKEPKTDQSSTGQDQQRADLTTLITASSTQFWSPQKEEPNSTSSNKDEPPLRKSSNFWTADLSKVDRGADDDRGEGTDSAGVWGSSHSSSKNSGASSSDTSSRTGGTADVYKSASNRSMYDDFGSCSMYTGYFDMDSSSQTVQDRPESLYSDYSDINAASQTDKDRPHSMYDEEQYQYLVTTSPDEENQDLPPQVFHVDRTVEELSADYEQLSSVGDGQTITTSKGSDASVSFREETSKDDTQELPHSSDYLSNNETDLNRRMDRLNEDIEQVSINNHHVKGEDVSYISNIKERGKSLNDSPTDTFRVISLCHGNGLSVEAHMGQHVSGHLSISLILHNHTAEMVTGVRVKLYGSQDLQLQLFQDEEMEMCWTDSVEIPADISGSDEASFSVMVKCTHPAPSLLLGGQVSWSENKLDFSLHIPITSFFKSYDINLEKYAEFWQHCKHSARVEIQADVTGQQNDDQLSATVCKLLQSLCFTCIQRIGSEAILASQSGEYGVCLLHSKVKNGLVILWLRTSLSGLAEPLILSLQEHFKGDLNEILQKNESSIADTTSQ